MPDIVEPSIDVECDSDFENDYDIYNELNTIYEQACYTKVQHSLFRL